MTSLIPSRRVADAFASAVDGAPTDDRFADLLACIAMLEATETPAPRAEFSTGLRERLMDAADTLLLPADDRPPVAVVALDDARRQRRHRRLSIAAATLVVVGGTAGVAAAAESSLPGDPLYPLKRGIEQAQVSFNSSDSGKGQDLLRLAGTRLDEVDGLISDDHPSGQIRSTLSSYQDAVSNGADLIFSSYQGTGDPTDISRLRTMLGAQMTQLDQLSGDAPSDTGSAFANARDLVAGLDQQARVLCPDCGPSGALSSARLSSAPALESLLVKPAERAQHGTTATQGNGIASLADKANDVAKQHLPALPITPEQTPGTPTTDQPGSGVKLPVGGPTSGPGTLPLQSTVKGVTGGVAGLLGNVTTTAGSTTAPLTNTLTETLTSLLGAKPSPSATPKP